MWPEGRGASVVSGAGECGRSVSLLTPSPSLTLSPSITFPLSSLLFPSPSYQDFYVEFHFSDNEWFSNKVLVKSYTVKCQVDTDVPWDFEGAAITSCKG